MSWFRRVRTAPSLRRTTEVLVRDRISRYTKVGDPSIILAENARRDAELLWSLVSTPDGERSTDVSALHALAWWHCFRYLALPEGANQEDLRLAIKFSQLLEERAPRLVPDLVRTKLSGGTGTDERYLKAMFGEACEALEAAGGPDALDLLKVAVAGFTRVLDLLPPGHPIRAAVLSNLGASLCSRYECGGDSSDLDAAVRAGQQAIELTAGNDHERASGLSNLAASLARRFERDGDQADLDAAIVRGHEALEAAPADDEDLTMFRSNLAAARRERFQLTGDHEDLDAAVTLGYEAVQATPDGHRDRANQLSNLAAAMVQRYRRDENEQDLDDAIDLAAQAVAVTPPFGSGRAGCLSTQGTALYLRFQRTGERADLAAATAAAEQAVQAANRPEPSVSNRPPAASHAEYLNTLATCVHSRFTITRDPKDLAEATALWQDAVRTSSAPAEQRLAAAWAWARSAMEAQQWSLAVEGYTAAVKVLPAMTRRGLDRVVQEANLSRWPGLAGDAAGCAVLAGRPDQAVELLDRGRLLLWTQSLELRSGAVTGHEPDHAGDATYDHLQQAAVGGPVVVLIASRNGCYALIVTAEREPHVVTLADLTAEDAYVQVRRLSDALKQCQNQDLPLINREQGRHSSLDVLAWLWNTVAEPVLLALGHPRAHDPGAAWERVWWCPTGPLAALPLHSAGRHPRDNRPRSQPVDCVAARVVSSYTPTLSALIRAQRPVSMAAQARQLVVGMPSTPGQEPLPRVFKEVDMLSTYFPAPRSADHLVGAAATRGNVLRALPSCSWLHLACHAYQDLRNPTASGFALCDGTLTVADLHQARLDRAELAFLSTCQTSTGSPGLLDESIHLAGAMQFLGFRHVIATMGTITDPVAVDVAKDVYAALSPDGVPRSDRAAEALHHATEQVRAHWPADPLLWALPIHLGP